MTALVWIRRVLLSAGVCLLAVYAAIRMDGAIQSRARLAAFDRQQKAHYPLPDHSRAVDLSLWSPNRIRGYQASLEASLSPPLAILEIPSIDLEIPVLASTDEIALNRGVGWVEGTALPGAAGNVGIAGHRDGFFRRLKDIRVGDKLELETLETHHEYVVDSIRIVTPQHSSVLRPRARPSLTLVTCYPFDFVGDAPQRYIVHATAMGAEPKDRGRSGDASAVTKISYPERNQ